MLRKDVNNTLNIGASKNETETCPYTCKKCIKLSKTEMGICSFLFKNKFQIICPNYFIKTDFVDLAANLIFKHANYKVIKELKYKDNFFDYVVINNDNYKDFFVIELQTLDTCGSYKYLSINWKTTEKNLVSQIVEKGQILKKYNSKLIVIIQDTFFDYLDIHSTNEEDNDIIFIIYENKANELKFQKSITFSIEAIKNRFNFDNDEDLIDIIYKKIS